jgi:hypothetical protein
VSLLASYRQRLAEEAVGRSDRFGKILRYFRAFWVASIVFGLAVAGWGIWTGGKWGFVFGSVYAFLIMLFGGVLYGLAQLFLSAKVERNG